MRIEKLQSKGSISDSHFTYGSVLTLASKTGALLFSPHKINNDSLIWPFFPIQTIWEAAKWNGIHPAFLMENPKSIDVSLWNRQGPWVPSCGWKAYPNNPEQIACFSAAQLLTFLRKKNTDRHEGMNNRKKHVCTVGVCTESDCNHVCVCVYTVCWLIVGKEHGERKESSETYAVGSDRRPVARKWNFISNDCSRFIQRYIRIFHRMKAKR